MKITSLELENVKRVMALRLEPAPNGLTVIGGRNAQGKTSVLDGIAAALGGAKYLGTNLTRNGAMNPAKIKLILDNGLVVERKGKSASLTVTDPEGKLAGQSLLDSFVSQFALDLPRFLNASTKEKALFLLDTLGIGAELKRLEEEEKRLYDERTAIGRIVLSKQKHAEELPEYPDAPEEPVSVSELLKQHQVILVKNGENQRLRDNLAKHESECDRIEQEIDRLEKQLEKTRELHRELCEKVATGRETAEKLEDESTEEIEASLSNIEAINAQVAANLAKSVAIDEAGTYQAQYDELTATIEKKRVERLALLEGANLPLPELTVEDAELVYKGMKWDCMSGSEHLKVAVAIAKAIKPQCGFVLMDKLEQMDPKTMAEFGAWLEEQNLQVIATRVTTNADECTIIIEDGLPQGQTYIEAKTGIIDEPATTVEDF